MFRNPCLRIVERQRIHGLNLYTADAPGLHRVQFAGQLVWLDGRAEPPPAHHRASIGGRCSKAAAQSDERISRCSGGRRRLVASLT